VDSEAAGPSVEPAGAVRRRPAPVTILAVIQIVLGTLNLAGAIALAVDPAMMVQLGGLIDRSAFAIVEGRILIAIFGLVGMLELTSAYLLLHLRQSGWTLAMLLSGTSLAVQIFTYFSNGSVTTLALVLNVVGVLYLNQSTVREAFGLVPIGHGSLEDERG
jgi:hypothetical protein